MNNVSAAKRDRVRLRPSASNSTATLNLPSFTSSLVPTLSHQPYSWICWTLFVAVATLVLSNAVYLAPLLMLSHRKRRALESARVMDRVHYDDFVNYVRMVDFCGSACYRTKTEAWRACWDKVRYCRVHFCRFEHEFGRMCKPIPGAWLPSSSPRPSPSPSIALRSSKLGNQPSIQQQGNLPEARCHFKESVMTKGRSMIFRVECDCFALKTTHFNASADAEVGNCLHAKFKAMTPSLETACRAQRNDSYAVYDWAFDTACSMCSGHRPRPTRCNLNA